MDRIEDKRLLTKYASMSCQACGSHNLVSGHHIKTRGSWGPDIEENLIALCFTHHTMIHQIGLIKFIYFFPEIEEILKRKGWEYDELQKKYKNYNLPN